MNNAEFSAAFFTLAFVGACALATASRTLGRCKRHALSGIGDRPEQSVGPPDLARPFTVGRLTDDAVAEDLSVIEHQHGRRAPAGRDDEPTVACRGVLDLLQLAEAIHAARDRGRATERVAVLAATLSADAGLWLGCSRQRDGTDPTSLEAVADDLEQQVVAIHAAAKAEVWTVPYCPEPDRYALEALARADELRARAGSLRRR